MEFIHTTTIRRWHGVGTAGLGEGNRWWMKRDFFLFDLSSFFCNHSRKWSDNSKLKYEFLERNSISHLMQWTNGFSIAASVSRDLWWRIVFEINRINIAKDYHYSLFSRLLSSAPHTLSCCRWVCGVSENKKRRSSAASLQSSFTFNCRTMLPSFTVFGSSACNRYHEIISDAERRNK